MRRALLIAAFSLFASTAHADWRLTDVSNEDGKAYKGWSVDFTGALEAQIYCDDWFPGMIDLTIYTGESVDAGASYAEDGVMTVRIDDSQEIDITAFFDEHEGEVLIYTSNFDVDGLEDLLLAMAEAHDSIGFSFYGRNFSFPARNLFEVLLEMSETCPTE